MRKHVKALVFAAAICLLLGLSFGAKAKAATDYDYKVTISGGLHGTVGTESVTMGYGERWNPNDYPVTVTDEKYYFKGFHISGKEGLVGTTTIEQDMVFVATYGIKGSTVSYTVNYQDADGNELAPSVTYYGNAGDKPIVAYVYIEGYQPQAYNLTGTITEEGPNVFTFIYTPIAAAGGEGGGTTPGGTTPGGTTPGGTTPGGTTPEDNTPGGTTPEDNTPGGEEPTTEPTTEPADIIDIDDQEVPLVNPDDPDGEGNTAYDKEARTKRNTIIAATVGAVGGVGLAALLIFLLRKRKKDNGANQTK